MAAARTHWSSTRAGPRTIAPRRPRHCGLVVHLSAGTAHAADTNAKVLVGEVEDALRLGADAVSVHVNIGSDTERRQLADLGTVAAACDDGACRCSR